MEEADAETTPPAQIGVWNMMQPSYNNSFDQLMAQVRKDLREQRIEEDLIALVRGSMERALNAQNVVLSRVEKERLLTDVMRSVLADVLARMGTGKNA